jgi:hypothetical protein
VAMPLFMPCALLTATRPVAALVLYMLLKLRACVSRGSYNLEVRVYEHKGAVDLVEAGVDEVQGFSRFGMLSAGKTAMSSSTTHHEVEQEET